MIDLPYRATAFGLYWRSDVPLVGFEQAPPGSTPPGVPIDVYRLDALEDRPRGRPVNRGFVYDDGIRFHWSDDVVFDMTEGVRIGYRPGPGWTGSMPASFYSTVTALTAAWRGMIPLHACAVELDGKAVLIAGAAGAGKSTLTADLLARGARFVADDLVVARIGDDGRIGVARGRPTIRLHADTAARLDTIDAAPVPGDPRGKWLAQPRRHSHADTLDLSAVLILDAQTPPEDTAPTPAAISASRLFAHLFRKRWIKALPMRTALMRDLLTIATKVPVLAYPAQPAFSSADRSDRPPQDPILTADAARQHRRAEAVIAILRAASGG